MRNGSVVRAVVVDADPLTGRVIVSVPAIGGADSRLPVSTIGREPRGGLWQVPAIGSVVLVAMEDTDASLVFAVPGYSWATPPITGTEDQVIVTDTTSGITLSLPQDVAVTSSPQFSGLDLTGVLQLSNTTSNLISYNAFGLSAPATTARSSGTKLVLRPTLSASTVDYALGVETDNMWFSVENALSGYKWYGSSNSVMSLSGSGDLFVSNSVTAASVTAASVNVNQIVQNNVEHVPTSSGATEPLNPLPGQMWYDTSTSRLKAYTGTAWKIVAGNWPRITCRHSATFTFAGILPHPWDTEDEKVDILHSTVTNSGHFTIPAGMGGIYYVSYSTLPTNLDNSVPTTYIDINIADNVHPTENTGRRYAQAGIQNYVGVEDSPTRSNTSSAYITVVPGDVVKLKCSHGIATGTWGINNRKEVIMFFMIMLQHNP